MTQPPWHHDFPDDVREMWDVVAKALLLRSAGNVRLTMDELRRAAGEQAEIALQGAHLVFRIIPN